MFTCAELDTYVMMTAHRNDFSLLWMKHSDVQKCILISWWDQIGMILVYFQRNVQMCRSTYLCHISADWNDSSLLWRKCSYVQKCIRMSYDSSSEFSLLWTTMFTCAEVSLIKCSYVQKCIPMWRWHHIGISLVWSECSHVQKCIPMWWRQDIVTSLVYFQANVYMCTSAYVCHDERTWWWYDMLMILLYFKRNVCRRIRNQKHSN